MKTSPRERRQQRTRTAILDTARNLINEGGIDALSMRKIAQEIDYSAAGLYEYFASKEDIVLTLCGEAEANLGNYLTQVDTSFPHLERLVALGIAYTRFAKNNREQFLLLFTNGPGALNTSNTSTDSPADSLGAFQILIDAVQDAANDDFFSLPRPEVIELSYTLWALVHGMAMLQLTALSQSKGDFETADRWALERFISGMASQ